MATNFQHIVYLAQAFILLCLDRLSYRVKEIKYIKTIMSNFRLNILCLQGAARTDLKTDAPLGQTQVTALGIGVS